jgi:hypothetical protein
VARDVETYLAELQAALISRGADPALVQDALFDAEEHLRAEMAGYEEAGGTAAVPEPDRAARFATVVDGYGTPDEVAAAYLGTEPGPALTYPVGSTVAQQAGPEEAAELAPPEGAPEQAHSEQPAQQARARCAACGTEAGPDQAFCVNCGAPLRTSSPTSPIPVYPPSGPAYPPPEYLPAGVQQGRQAAGPSGSGEPSVWREIFGPFADGRVWTSLVYMLLSLFTGVAYFTIVVTGLATAGGMLVLIIGIPLFMLVLAIVRGLALFEGRLVETLLGTRMPRRTRPTPPNFGFWQRMLFWLRDGRTWASMAYMLLMLPIGIAYFTIAVTGLAVGISLATTPIWGWIPWAAHDVITVNGVNYDWPAWAIPIAFVVGVLVLIGFMHAVKWIGRGHAAFAKAMLVRLK